MILHEAVIRQQIANLLISFPDMADDEVLRADSIEAETDAFEFISKLMREYGEAGASHDAMCAYSSDILDRAARFNRRQEALKDLIERIMRAANLRKVPRPEGTAYFQNGRPKVILVDEAAIPDEFVKIERTPKKSEIADAIKDGKTVPGAELSNGSETLVIRTK